VVKFTVAENREMIKAKYEPINILNNSNVLLLKQAIQTKPGMISLPLWQLKT
jgi:hypothetical protein